MTSRRKWETPPRFEDATQGDLWQANAQGVMTPIDRTGIADGWVVVWDATLGRHVYAEQTGTGGSSTLIGLTDVVPGFNPYAESQSVIADGSEFIIRQLLLNDLGQVLLAGEAEGQFIVRRTGLWVNEDVNQGTSFGMDQGGAVLTPGYKFRFDVPFDLTITRARLLADQVGSMVVDLEKMTYAAYPAGASVCAAAKPTLTGAQKYQDTTLTGWTVNWNEGDVVLVNLVSCATITQATLAIKYRRR